MGFFDFIFINFFKIFSEENIMKFNNEMREYWHRLYVSLSTHNLLEIFARQFSYSLRKFFV